MCVISTLCVSRYYHLQILNVKSVCCMPCVCALVDAACCYSLLIFRIRRCDAQHVHRFLCQNVSSKSILFNLFNSATDDLYQQQQQRQQLAQVSINFWHRFRSEFMKRRAKTRTTVRDVVIMAKFCSCSPECIINEISAYDLHCKW